MCLQIADARGYPGVYSAPEHEPASRDWCCVWGYPAPEPLTDEASKVVALPQTPPGAEPPDLNTCARFR